MLDTTTVDNKGWKTCLQKQNYNISFEGWRNTNFDSGDSTKIGFR
jgi:hypothetical protein